MTEQTRKKSATQRQNALEYRAEAMATVKTIGASRAINELGLHESLLRRWRDKACTAQDRSEIWWQQAVEIARLVHQLAEVAEYLAIVTKDGHILRQKPEVKFVFMDQHAPTFRVTTIWPVLNV
jgi:transposase